MNKSSSVGSLQDYQNSHPGSVTKVSLHEITLPQSDLRLPNIGPKAQRTRSLAHKAQSHLHLNLPSPSHRDFSQPNSPVKLRL